MRSYFIGAGDNFTQPSTTSTGYGFIQDSYATGWSLSVTTRESVVPHDLVIDRFRVDITNAPGAGKSYTFTVMKNGSPTSVTCTISDSATSASDTTHSVSFSAGDKIVIECVPSGTPAATGAVQRSLRQTASNKTAMTTSTNSPSNSVNGYLPLAGSTGSNQTTDAVGSQIVPTAGVIQNLYVRINNAPGAGKNYTYTLYKNGSPTSLTCIISDSATSASDTSNSVSFSAGDTASLEIAPSGTPTSSSATSLSASFSPSIDGESFIGTSNVAAASTSSTEYHLPQGASSSWAASETVFIRGGVTTITALYAKLVTAPSSGKSWNFTVRKELADTAATLTISDTNTQGNITGQSVAVADGDRISLESTPSGTPTSSQVKLSILFFIQPDIDSAISDNVSLSETIGYYSETAFTRESVTVQIGAPPPTDSAINVNNSIAVSESVFRMLESSVSKSESITVSESVQRLLESRIAVSDSTTLSESVQRVSELNINKSESVTISESANLLVSPLIQLATGTSTSSSVSATFPSTPTQGNLIAALVYANKVGSVVSISGWTLAISQDFTTALSVSLFYKKAGAGESTSVTANATAATVMELQVFEYSGGLTTLDQTASTADTGVNVTTRSSGTTGTTQSSNELVIAGIGFNNDQGDNVTWTNSFTGRTVTSHLVESDKTANSVATYESRAGWSTGVRAVGVIATFNSALSVNVSDSITYSESASVKREYNISVSDTTALDDEATVLLEGVQASDSISVAESLALSLTSFINVANSITVSEFTVIEPSILSITTSQTINVSEVYSVDLQVDVNVSDSISTSESLNVATVNQVGLSDQTTASESMNHYSDQVDVMEFVSLMLQQGQGEIGVSEFEVVNESVLLDMSIGLSVSDSASISEYLDVARDASRNISLVDNRLLDESGNPILDEDGNFITDETPGGEIVLSSEQVTSRLESNISKTENVVVSESVSLLIPTLFISISENVTVSETKLVIIPTLFAAVSDSISITESVTSRLISDLRVSDSVAVSEFLSFLNSLNRSVSESVTVQDVPQLLIPTLFINVSEAVLVTEALSAARVNANDLTITVSDVPSGSDNTTLELTVGLSVSDSITVSEVCQQLVESSISKTDNITVSESRTVRVESAIAVQETINTTDSPTLLITTLFISITDNVQVTDVAFTSIEVTGVGTARLLALLGAG